MTEMDLLFLSENIIEKGFGQGDTTVIDRFISDDFVEHQFGMKSGIEGKGELKRNIQVLHNAFPDMNYILLNHIRNDSTVWCHFQASGTHQGEFMGFPPSGKSFSIDVFEIMRFRDGRLVEHWGSPDRFALFNQLGLIHIKR
jgi:steroid delta-isomerase-like uncharacterized protein